MLTDFLTPRLARFFTELSAIPRGSGNEAGVADYLVLFAENRGLEVYRDRLHNVLIKKAGSKGREQEAALLLQAHTDMVTEARLLSQHDFLKDGITLLQKGNLLFADGTTLGADDGFGVALMLAVLDGAESHPPLECLFTTCEETGMDGAAGFDYQRISARRLVNLDTNTESDIVIGCCGGLYSTLALDMEFSLVEGQAFRLSLQGLRGGHSGEDIHRNRGNAHTVMGRLLSCLYEQTKFRVASISGGNKDNAIPRECEAVILPDDPARFCEVAKGLTPFLNRLLDRAEDPDAKLVLKEAEAERAFSHADTERLLAALGVENGVLAWRKGGEGAPDISRNLAKISTGGQGILLRFFARASREDALDWLERDIERFALTLGGSVCHSSRHVGWESAGEGQLCLQWKKALGEVTGIKPTVSVIHAGLECGMITAALPGTEAISVGCNIHDLHTPAETMELDSFERIYKTLLRFLEGC